MRRWWRENMRNEGSYVAWEVFRAIVWCGAAALAWRWVAR